MINIVLFEPEIPQNTGNIMRTCVATSAHLHLIKPLGFYMDEAHLRRSGVDYVNECKYTLYDNFEDFLSKNSGEMYFFTRYGKKAHSEFKFDKDKDIYLIFGKESTGIPKIILRRFLDRCIRIPTTDGVRALNLSNCVAIGVYEVMRQFDYNGLLRTEPFKGENYIEE